MCDSACALPCAWWHNCAYPYVPLRYLVLGSRCVLTNVISKLPALTHASAALLAETLLYLLQIPTPSPSSVFIRENAIIFNIESLRMIITKDEASTLSCAAS